MDFINRDDELDRLNSLIGAPRGALAVIYGRRRIGKTRLLLEWSGRHGGIYTVADQSTADVQRRYFAEALSVRLEGFDEVEYPDWRALLSRLAREARQRDWRGPLILDELPYLVQSSPEIASVLQHFVDHEAREASLVVAIAGSSQTMMQGLVLDSNAPLYGRAQTILDVGPIAARFLDQAFRPKGIVPLTKLYAAWGGVPRYWELAEQLGGGLRQAIDHLVLDPMGPLHREPDRLLTEELPPAVELRPILDAIGAGAHRLSEIAGRIGRPATSMPRPLRRLTEMKLIRREVPFGESEKKTRRSLYKIDDPFIRLWFRVVAPHRAQLASGSRKDRLSLLDRFFGALTADAWEELARSSIASARSKRLEGFGAGSRWWRANLPEWDVVAESHDGSRLLLGECKWSDRAFGKRACEQISREVAARPAPELPKRYRNHDQVRCLLVPSVAGGAPDESSGVLIVNGDEILNFD